MLDTGSADRVLLLGAPPDFAAYLALAERLAVSLEAGLLVGLLEDRQVGEARRALRHLDNAMFVCATPDRIPWQDGFFTRVIDLASGWENADGCWREVARVLACGGRAEMRLAAPAGLEGVLAIEDSGAEAVTARKGA